MDSLVDFVVAVVESFVEVEEEAVSRRSQHFVGNWNSDTSRSNKSTSTQRSEIRMTLKMLSYLWSLMYDNTFNVLGSIVF